MVLLPSLFLRRDLEDDLPDPLEPLDEEELDRRWDFLPSLPEDEEDPLFCWGD